MITRFLKTRDKKDFVEFLPLRRNQLKVNSVGKQIIHIRTTGSQNEELNALLPENWKSKYYRNFIRRRKIYLVRMLLHVVYSINQTHL